MKIPIFTDHALTRNQNNCLLIKSPYIEIMRVMISIAVSKYIKISAYTDHTDYSNSSFQVC